MFSVRILRFLFCISLLLSTLASTSNYCAISKHHLLCDDPPGYLPRCPKGLIKFPQTTSDREAILEGFNSFRNEVAGGKEIRGNVRLAKAAKLKPMKWSHKLEQAAINVMNNCNIYDFKFTCYTNNIDYLPALILNYHGLSDYPSLLKEPEILLRRMVDVVVRHPEEVKKFTAQMMRVFKVENFEQDKILVLANEKVLRVGAHIMGIITQVGNSKRFVYNMTFMMASSMGLNRNIIYEVGEPCSKCPNSKCSANYENLCDCSGGDHPCEPAYVDPKLQCDPPNRMLGTHPTIPPARIKALNLLEDVDLSLYTDDHSMREHSHDYLLGEHGLSMNRRRGGFRDFGNIKTLRSSNKKKVKEVGTATTEGTGGDEEKSSNSGIIMSLNIFLSIPALALFGNI